MNRRRFFLILALRAILGLTAIFLLLSFWLITTRSGLKTAAWLANHLCAETLAIRGVEGRLSSTCSLQGLSIKAGGVRLEFGETQLSWRLSELLHNALPARALSVASFHIYLPEDTEENDEGPDEERLTMPELYFPVAIYFERVLMKDFRIISAGETVFDLHESEVHHLTARGHELGFSSVSTKNDWLQARVQNGRVTAKGDWPSKAELESALHFSAVSPLKGTAQIEGDFARMGVKLALTSPEALTLQGEVTDILNALRWQARIEAPKLALKKISPDWPELAFKDVQIDSRGDTGEYKLSLAAGTEPSLIKKNLGLAATLQITPEGLAVEKLTLKDRIGLLHLHGFFHWSPDLAWQADILADKANPNALFEELPGELSGKLSVRGAWQGEDLCLTSTIEELSGHMRGLPVAAQGGFSYQGQVFNFDQARLEVGRSKLGLTGQAGPAAEHAALALNIDSPDLGNLLPQLGGTLHLEAELTGPGQAPIFSAKFAGSELRYKKQNVASLNGKANGSLARGGQWALSLRAQGINASGRSIDELESQLTGTLQDHSLKVRARAPEGGLSFLLNGEKTEEGWKGQVAKTRAETRAFGLWLQEEPAKLELSPQKARLERFCLRQNAASLCALGNMNDEQNWQGELDIAALPLALLQASMRPGLSIKGQLNAKAHAGGRAGQLKEAALDAVANGLNLTFSFAGKRAGTLAWTRQEAHASYESERLEVCWNQALDDGSSVDLRLICPHAPLAQGGEALLQAPLEGNLTLSLRRLDFLGPLSQQKTQWSGMLQGDVQLAGTAAKPQFAGNLALIDGAVSVPSLGLNLSPLSLTFISEHNQVLAELAAHSGAGFLKARGGLDLSQDRPAVLPLTLQGENFRAMGQPGLEVDISPELRAEFAEQGLKISGSVAAPHVYVEDVNLDSTISPSADVVVMDDPKAKTRDEELPVHAKVRLDIGDDVVINAYGLYAKLDGHMLLLREPGRPLTGNGEVKVEKGAFSAYGKRVKIDTGRLLFSGGPLENPGLDIKSEHTKNSITAGMRVSGSLKRPYIQLYSRPQMEQTSIVAHLVEDKGSFGKDRGDTGVVGETAEKLGMGGIVPYLESLKRFSMIDDIKLDTSDETAALVMGSWVTPSLYVSYGTSLGGDGPVFSTRYALGKGFVVETESGSLQTGGDIKYEFEH